MQREIDQDEKARLLLNEVQAGFNEEIEKLLKQHQEELKEKDEWIDAYQAANEVFTLTL